MANIYSRVTSRKVRRSVAALTATLILPSMFLPAVTGLARGAADPHRVELESPSDPVHVNRTAAPTADPNPPVPSFTSPVTDVQISSVTVFEEPLVRISNESNAPAKGMSFDEARVAENGALAMAVADYARARDSENLSPFLAFEAKFPSSAWIPSLELDLGLVYWRTGYFLRAMGAWTRAWSLAKDARDASGRAVADRAVGELAALYARLGRVSDLEALLAEVGERPVSGPATERLAAAREGLWMMKNVPGESFRCGPMALDRICAARDPKAAPNEAIVSAQSTDHGLSLANVAELADRVHMGLQIAKREPGAGIIVPAVVHWKAGHYAALLQRSDVGATRYQVQDPTFKIDIWVSQKALDEESSGYFLVPKGDLPAGWTPVSAAEAATVWGKGNVGNLDETCTSRCDFKAHGSCGSCGAGGSPAMPTYDLHTFLVSLSIEDTPVGYTPPRGPAVYFTIDYSERDTSSSGMFATSMLGPKWTFDWLSYVSDNPSALTANADVYLRGGGSETNINFSGTGAIGQWALQRKSSTVLARTLYNAGTGATTYERRHSDGSKEVFSQVSSAMVGRRVYLTQVVDTAGNALTLNYTGSRLSSITDAIGQTTTIDYGSTNPALPEYYQIAKVTDPFGRYATFTYTSGHLTGITDVISLTSSFAYSDPLKPDNITSMTTPYGTTTFARGQGVDGGVLSGDPSNRWIEATDPLGATERVEYRRLTVYTADGKHIDWNSEPIPDGYLYTAPGAFIWRNSFYWDKRAYGLAVPLTMGSVDRTKEFDYTKSRVTHWIHLDGSTATGVPQSTKEPLESRIWYRYDGQTSFETVGTTDNKTEIERVLDSGVTQRYRFTYNGAGNVLSYEDPQLYGTPTPKGRTTTISYYTGDIDVYQVKQYNAGIYNTLATFTYNTQHRPLTHADAAGQTTTLTWNAYGQLATVTNAKSELTTYGYDTSGYLVSVTGPVTGATFGYTYDTYGRAQTTTDPDGFVTTYTYDPLDRWTRVTYPDLTHRDRTFDTVKKLNVVSASDRMGRTTTYTYDALGRTVTVTDPKLQMTQYNWCTCGSLASITDGNSHTTSYDYDVQGRKTKETMADSTFSTYAYETRTSRFKTYTDAKSQTTSYGYNTDDTVSSVTYAGSAVTTPNISFAYDPYYKRPTSRTDGDGTATFTYYVTGVLGALQAYQVYEAGPGATTTYTYDQLGRRLGRSTVLSGSTVSSTVTYDALNRVATMTSLLGTATINYDGTTSRPLTFGFGTGTAPRMTFSYGGNTDDHRLLTVQFGTATLVETFGRRDYDYDEDGLLTLINYDNAAKADKLTYDAARQLTDDKILASTQYHYDYDAAGNRTQETTPTGTTSAVYNNVNELTSTSGASTATYTYDTNGSVTSDGTRTYTWDGANRLKVIQTGTLKSVFSYDGLSRCTRIQEYTGATLTSDQKYLWSGEEMIGQQLISGTGSTRLFYPEGMRDATNSKSYVYGRDRLGSVVTMSNTSGVLQTKYDTEDLYGRRVKTTGTVDSSFGFGGYFVHARSGLSMTHYRFYDPNTGRWLSRDPMSILGGLNLYRYVQNRPTTLTDPLGLAVSVCFRQGWPEVGGVLLAGVPSPVGVAGNHSYLWDNTGNSWPPFCGRGKTAFERGPRSMSNVFGDVCYAVPNTDGQETEIMARCNELRQNDGKFNLFTNNCHNLIDHTLAEFGTEVPLNRMNRWFMPTRPAYPTEGLPALEQDIKDLINWWPWS